MCSFVEHKGQINSTSLQFRPIRVNKTQTTNTVHKIHVQSHKQHLKVLFVTNVWSVLLGLLNEEMSKYIYGLTINTSSVAANLALQALQNGNGLHFPPPQVHGSSSHSTPQGTQSYISSGRWKIPISPVH